MSTYEEDNLPILIFYKNLIPYSSLDKMFKQEFMGCDSKCVNIYIDLFSFLSDLYRTTNFTNIWNITSSIVNMGIHYRNYFAKRGMYSNIIFVYSPNQCSINVKYIKNWYIGYRTLANSNPVAVKSIMSNIELLGTMIPYAPQMYLKIGSATPTVTILNIVQKAINSGTDLGKYPNIYITRDPYAFQLPAILPNVVLFFKKYKKNREDNSFSVNYGNCLNEYIKLTKNVAIEEQLPANWLSPYMTIAGIGSKYGVNAILNYDKSLAVLFKLSSEYSNFTPDNIYATIKEISPSCKITLEDIYNRFRCLDILHQLAEYNVLPESQEFSWTAETPDMNMLLELNNRYFKKNPIDIDRLG